MINYFIGGNINWDNVNRAQIREIVEKEFKRARNEIPILLSQSEIFNFMPLSYEDESGYSCYLGLKKYPNVYAIFEYRPTNITQNVVFQYYIDKKHFINYSLPLYDFFDLIHFNDGTQYFSEEFFYDIIKKIVGDIETDRFYISDGINFEKNMAERMVDGGRYVFYELTDDGCLNIDFENETYFANLKMTYFEVNPLQHKLLLLWLSDKNGKEKYLFRK